MNNDSTDKNKLNLTVGQVAAKNVIDKIEQVSDSIKRNQGFTGRVIREDVFVHHFLPIFSGESIENFRELMSQWITVAGSPFNPVHVINKNNETVAVVPPIKNTFALMPDMTSRYTTADGFGNAERLSQVSPSLGARAIDEFLTSRVETLTQTPSTVENTDSEKWNTLLLHYGKKVTNKSSADNKNGPDSSPTEYEY